MNAVTKLLIVGPAGAPALATAHDGHSMPSVMHFQASDAWGFAMLTAVAVAVFLLSRKQ